MYMSRDMTKPTKWVCAQQRSAWASTQSDQSSLCTQWVAKDSGQTGWMPRLIWVFAWRTLTLLVSSCHGSYVQLHLERNCIFQLVPDPESNRCKVVIGSCETEKPYKVYVVAIPAGNQTFYRLLDLFLLGVFLKRIAISIFQHDYRKWQNQQNDLCTQRRLRSACASAQSDQSLHCPHEKTLSL